MLYLEELCSVGIARFNSGFETHLVAFLSVSIDSDMRYLVFQVPAGPCLEKLTVILGSSLMVSFEGHQVSQLLGAIPPEISAALTLFIYNHASYLPYLRDCLPCSSTVKH